MCGVVGVVGSKETAVYTAVSCMRALQHRGQEGMGIASWLNGEMLIARREGEVLQALSTLSIADFKSTALLGHTRYATIGEGRIENVQPVVQKFRGKSFALVHNGSLVNLQELSDMTGKDYKNLSDTHIVADLIAQSRLSSIEDALIEAASKLRGSYNLIVLFGGDIYAMRDPHGFHPLQIGQGPNGEHVVASESYAFDFIGGNFIRDVWAGEFIHLSKQGFHYLTTFGEDTKIQVDIFEFQYYLSPASIVHGVEVGAAREMMGAHLADIYASLYSIPQGAVVAPIPDSGNQAALGFSKKLRTLGYDISFEPHLIFRSHASNVHRAFIEPTKKRRLGRCMPPSPATSCYQLSIPITPSASFRA